MYRHLHLLPHLAPPGHNSSCPVKGPQMGFFDGLKAALRALPQPALLAAPLQGWYCCWYYCCYCFGTAFAFAAFAAFAAAAFAAAAAAAAAAAGTGGSGCGGDDFRGGGGGCSGGGSGIGGAAVVGAAHTRRPLRVAPPTDTAVFHPHARHTRLGPCATPQHPQHGGQQVKWRSSWRFRRLHARSHSTAGSSLVGTGTASGALAAGGCALGTAAHAFFFRKATCDVL